MRRFNHAKLTRLQRSPSSLGDLTSVLNNASNRKWKGRKASLDGRTTPVKCALPCGACRWCCQSGVRREGGCVAFPSSAWATTQNKAMHHGKAGHERAREVQHDDKVRTAASTQRLQREGKKDVTENVTDLYDMKCWSRCCRGRTGRQAASSP